jgi:hypothetical protein
MPDFTEEQWYIKNDPYGTPEIYAGSGHVGDRPIARVLYWLGSEDVDIVEANARLIVQSPQMYNDLRLLLAECAMAKHTGDIDFISDDSLDRVRGTLTEVDNE